MQIIIKYSNRKLYSKTDKGYVTLTDIADKIANGQDVQVTDNKTKEDITNVTLLKVFNEINDAKYHTKYQLQSNIKNIMEQKL